MTSMAKTIVVEKKHFIFFCITKLYFLITHIFLSKFFFFIYYYFDLKSSDLRYQSTTLFFLWRKLKPPWNIKIFYIKNVFNLRTFFPQKIMYRKKCKSVFLSFSFFSITYFSVILLNGWKKSVKPLFLGPQTGSYSLSFFFFTWMIMKKI